jgi:hypothetical protein
MYAGMTIEEIIIPGNHLAREPSTGESNFEVSVGLPLAYIGNVSRTAASGRVRCGCEAFSIRR